ncbi:MAG: prolyl oligopeptidase family serine peptidase [Solirubrobacteraceae bacterium]
MRAGRLLSWEIAIVFGCLLMAASAAGASPLRLGSCRSQLGVYQCSGLAKSWDGLPLDTTVTLPRRGAHGLPLVTELNGFGNSKYEYLDPSSHAYTGDAYDWARRGYAVLTYTARGFWGSCGTPESRLASAHGCAHGYIHLADARYEVRDAQYLIGRLVDQRIANPARIGVTGDSYGGGQTFDVAALRNRVMLPDGTVAPWRSPHGTPLHVAAAAPIIPWTDLVYAAAPNGRTLSYAVTPPKVDSTPIGVQKVTFTGGVYASGVVSTGPGQPIGQPQVPGRPIGWFAPPLTDPNADVTTWLGRSTVGEPYIDPTVADVVTQLNDYRSAYYIDDSEAPAPLLVGSGFTDDLFPIAESLRFANRLRTLHPHAPLSLWYFDFGHQRGANRTADRTRLLGAIYRWFDHYLRGRGRRPRQGVTTMTQTCPHSRPSAGPFRAATFAQLAHGEVRRTFTGSQTVQSVPGNPAVGAAIDPLTGGGDDCATTSAALEPGTAAFSLRPAPKTGYTLMGAPTISASLTVAGSPGAAQIAGRLWDVAPDGTSQTLVARGLFRPTGSGRYVWQLNANGWRFAPGHVPKLELLGEDPPYARPSNGSFSIGVSHVQLRLPVRNRPDCRVVMPQKRPVLPSGYRLAPGVHSAWVRSHRFCRGT